MPTNRILDFNETEKFINAQILFTLFMQLFKQNETINIKNHQNERVINKNQI